MTLSSSIFPVISLSLPLSHTRARTRSWFVRLTTTKQLAKHLLAPCGENKTLSLLPLKSSCPINSTVDPDNGAESTERYKETKKRRNLHPFATSFHLNMCVCVSVVDGFQSPPPLHPSPSQFLFNVTGLAHMTLSGGVGTARARAASPAGALELDLQDKNTHTHKRARNLRAKPDRHLSHPSPPPHTHTPLLSSFIQSTPLLICSPWWEEIYRDAVSLTSLSAPDRN